MVSARTFLFLLLCLCAAVPALAGQDYSVNERPMYGNVEKTPAMLQADQAFLESIVKAGMTREQGAVDAVRRGWRALAENDMRTAILRFNQG